MLGGLRRKAAPRHELGGLRTRQEAAPGAAVSHKATVWAIQQRGLPPAAKIVLWHLCDRYHPDNGCFPSQETLAADCELSRSSLNDQLDRLVAAGLIRRERQHSDGNRRRPTRYRFAFEPDFDLPQTAEPRPEFGHGAMSEFDEKPCPNFAESHVRNSDSNLVKEPVIEPQRESARAEIEDFEKVRRAWPSGFADSREEALTAWRALSADERTEAAAEIGRFTATTKSVGRRMICGLAAYLRERKWMALPDRPKLARADGNGSVVRPEPPKPAGPTAFQRKWAQQQAEKIAAGALNAMPGSEDGS